MDLLTLALVVLAGATAVAIAAEAIRRPILCQMAARNALRRPKQTVTVVAGLLIGTAIISSALVAGDSARGAIRGYVYQSLGEVDESVAIPAYPFFPEAIHRLFATDPALRGDFDAVAPHVIWQGAAEEPESGLFEPNVAVVGYDLDADAGFGVFETDAGSLDGRGLRPGQAIVTEVLAKALEAGPGDTVRLSYVAPIDPLLPRLHFLNGTAGPGTPAPLPLPLPPQAPKVAAGNHAIPVGPGATRIVLALGWQLAPAPPLPATASVTATLTAPSGTRFEAAGGYPLWLNVTAAPDAVLEEGNWTLAVAADLPDTPYSGVVIVLHPVYDLALLQERAEALQKEFGDLKDAIEGLTGFSERRTVEFTVAAVTTGGRGDLFDLRNVLFIGIGEAQQLFGREGQINVLKFSNPGDAKQGEAGSAAAMQLLNQTLEKVRGRYPGVPSVQALQANNLKHDSLATADNAGQTLTNLLVFAGSLSIITGLLLILNIFTMLAEERRSELGMARAVGLTRSDLVRMFLFEGFLYAIAAAIIGALLGMALAFLMIEVMNAIVSQLASDLSFPPIEYRPSLDAFLAAASTGALLTSLTILFASLRQSRLNVVRAIRRLEEPEHLGSRLA
ncbi:MAG: putative transport system permease protein, partial [Thermoplasmata archaeon]|nr:putative transport system permease protein [Thermoplasmata archaeon]